MIDRRRVYGILKYAKLARTFKIYLKDTQGKEKGEMLRRIMYYSTNRDLDGVKGIKPFKEEVSFKDALIMGQAPDEGLFMPQRIPYVQKELLAHFRGNPYSEIALWVAWEFLNGEMSFNDLRPIVEDSYNFPVPLEQVSGRRYVMRLDQGPTASFKDFAARLMARLMSYFLGPGQRLHVLVATSGDTGSAVGDAYKGVPGIAVTILYPRDEVSGRQKKQLDTMGGNIQAISVAGKFDDCQNMVKQAFSDPALAGCNLNSANSINWGRIMPQIIYYFYAYIQLAKDGEPIIFSVPSGNFGDALGCEYARRMGLPVEKLVIATNENDEFPRFMESGVYAPLSPSRACLSNAMNVGHPSNLARLFDLYGGTVDRKGVVYKYPDLEEMRRRIFAVSVSDEETRRTIKGVYERFAVVFEPHGAVGWRGLERLSCHDDSKLCVSLETAHPAKFPEVVVEEAYGLVPDLPQSMKDIDDRTGKAPIQMAADYEALKGYLLS